MGYASPGKMMTEMSVEEYHLWFELHKTDPLTDPWAQTGVIASTVLNSFTGANSVPSDFIPSLERVERSAVQQSPEEMKAVLASILSNVPVIPG